MTLAPEVEAALRRAEAAHAPVMRAEVIGRASCRERV